MPCTDVLFFQGNQIGSKEPLLFLQNIEICGREPLLCFFRIIRFAQMFQQMFQVSLEVIPVEVLHNVIFVFLSVRYESILLFVPGTAFFFCKGLC